MALMPGHSTMWATMAWFLHKRNLRWATRGTEVLKYTLEVFKTPEEDLGPNDLENMGKFWQPALAAADMSRVLMDCSIMAGFSTDHGAKMSKCLAKVFGVRWRRNDFMSELHKELLATNVLNTVCRMEDMDKIMENRARDRRRQLKDPKKEGGGGKASEKTRCRCPDDCRRLKHHGACSRYHTKDEIAAQVQRGGSEQNEAEE